MLPDEVVFNVLILNFCVVLPVQLLLCFKVKNIAIRLIPSAILFALSAFFFVMIYCTIGLDSLGYALLAMLTGSMLFMSGVGWGIWLVAHILKKKKRKPDPESLQ